MRYRGSSSTPKACSFVRWSCGERAISSTPQACGWVFHHPRRGATGLPRWRDALELVAEILEVVRVDAQSLHLLDDRQEIGQRANGAQRLGIGGPDQPARRCQDECVFDHAYGDAALEQLHSQQAVRTADGPRRSRRFAIRFQDPMNELFLAVVHGGTQPCRSRSDGPSIFTVWQ